MVVTKLLQSVTLAEGLFTTAFRGNPVETNFIDYVVWDISLLLGLFVLWYDEIGTGVTIQIYAVSSNCLKTITGKIKWGSVHGVQYCEVYGAGIQAREN